jgi:hypothetical protein
MLGSIKPYPPRSTTEARNNLTQQPSDPNLATRAPQAITAADAAVNLAEQRS